MLTAQSSVAKVQLIEALKQTRARTQDLVDDLNETQLMGPRLQIVNPLRWEIGHIAWFQESWVLRHLVKRPAILKHGDELYDSARVVHDTRWDLPLPERDATLEQMHDEAITCTRQSLSYPPPIISIAARQTPDVAVANRVLSPRQDPALTQTDMALTGDAVIPGGAFPLGSASEQAFAFDNELPAHEVEIGPFAISRTAVTNGEFKHFVEDAGYGRGELWTAEGWQWRTSVGAEHPVYWRREGNGRWLRRNFDEWVALDERMPILHVNWYEADGLLPLGGSTSANGSGDGGECGANGRRSRTYIAQATISLG